MVLNILQCAGQTPVSVVQVEKLPSQMGLVGPGGHNLKMVVSIAPGPPSPALHSKVRLEQPASCCLFTPEFRISFLFTLPAL